MAKPKLTFNELVDLRVLVTTEMRDKKRKAWSPKTPEKETLKLEKEIHRLDKLDTKLSLIQWGGSFEDLRRRHEKFKEMG